MRIASYRLALILLTTGAICLAAVCPGLVAEERPAGKAAKPKKEELTGTCDSWQRSWGGNKDVTLMEGNVKFTHGDTVISSDRIEYDKNAQVAASPRKLRITNPDVDVAGDKGITQFSKRVAVVEGSVVMLVKPKKTAKDSNPDSASGKLKEPTTVTCPKLEYNYKKKIAIATGGVQLKQSKRTLTAEKAVFDETKEFLVLTGNVKGVDEDGQTFSAPGKVEVSLKEGDEWMRAENATATFKVDVEEDESDQ